MPKSTARGPRVLFHHQLHKRRQKRKRPRTPRAPELTVAQILAWADDFHARTGRWPTQRSGRIAGSIGEKWLNVSVALRLGLRGLPGGSSLARLLAEHRGVRNVQNLPPLVEQRILAWADAHHQRTGDWPSLDSGPIAEAPGETWMAVDAALRQATRGCPGGSSLAQLLEAYRGVRNRKALPPLSEEQILSWADDFHRRTGRWPTSRGGPIPAAPGETWSAVEDALLQGHRGLAGGSSLARLLAEHRSVRNPQDLPRLMKRQILAWADAHFQRTGQWPTYRSGAIPEAPGETWCAVDVALQRGRRGLGRAGSSLTRLLAQHRGVRNEKALPRFTVAKILRWADAHHRRTGRWPKRSGGPIQDAPGETWAAVEKALRSGMRGLPGGSSLAQLLATRRGVRNEKALPRLTHDQILRWADAHYERTSCWPTSHSGPIPEAPGETWGAVNHALKSGGRGLPPGPNLPLFLQAHGRKGGRVPA